MTTPATIEGTRRVDPPEERNGAMSKGTMNVALVVRDYAMRQAEDLEGEALDLLRKARQKMEEAAVCRMLAATTEENPRDPA